MKKLSPFDPVLITKAYFPQFIHTPDQINYGQCFEWAIYAHDTFKGIELYDITIHAFVKHGGKYYDSERPQGEKDWHDLPACSPDRDTMSMITPLRKYTRSSFITRWNTQTFRFNTSWQQMTDNVKKVLKAANGK